MSLQTFPMTPAAAKEFIVFRDVATATPVTQLLAHSSGVRILKALDENTVLVSMSEQACDALQLEFPELVIEANLEYKLLGR